MTALGVLMSEPVHSDTETILSNPALIDLMLTEELTVRAVVFLCIVFAAGIGLAIYCLSIGIKAAIEAWDTYKTCQRKHHEEK